jgi:chromosome segregation ATPase
MDQKKLNHLRKLADANMADSEVGPLLDHIGQLESDNAELRAVVAVHEETIAALRRDLSDERRAHEAVMSGAEKTIAELRKNRATLDADLDTTARHVDEMRTKIANQAAHIRELEGATNHAGGLHAPR